MVGNHALVYHLPFCLILFYRLGYHWQVYIREYTNNIDGTSTKGSQSFLLERYNSRWSMWNSSQEKIIPTYARRTLTRFRSLSIVPLQEVIFCWDFRSKWDLVIFLIVREARHGGSPQRFTISLWNRTLRFARTVCYDGGRRSERVECVASISPLLELVYHCFIIMHRLSLWYDKYEMYFRYVLISFLLL